MDETALQLHSDTLASHTAAASELLTYWLQQREVVQGDKEAFEGVVENLVGYHRRQRQQVPKKAATKKMNRFSLKRS